MSNYLSKMMKGAMLMFAALTANISYAQAESITICDGTDISTTIPFYFYYLDTPNTTSQMIYPASELEAFVGKQITGLKFYHEGYKSAWNATMKVSLAEVDFATIPESNAAYIDADFREVFNGEVSGDESISTLEYVFATPFVYTGKNLVVNIENLTAGSWMSLAFYGKNLLGDFNATYGYGGGFKYNQGFLPKVTVSYSAGELNEFDAAVSTEALDFSTVFTGESVTKNITIINNGSADLNAVISGIEAPFSVTETNISISSLNSVTIPVTFTPVADGTYNQTLSIDLGQAGTFPVTLSGSSMTAPSGYQQTFDVENKTLPQYWTGWVVKSTYNSDLFDYAFESAEASSEYFVGVDIENVQAIGIQDEANPFRSYPSKYDIYMISPEVSGNVLITARGTNPSEYLIPELKAFKVSRDSNGAYTIGDAIEIVWTSELTNTKWSNATFVMEEPTQIALFMNYSAVSMFASDVLGDTSGGGTSGGGDDNGDDDNNDDETGNAITICDGTDETDKVPFYFYNLDTDAATSQVIYPASALEAFVGKQITGLKFYHKGYGKDWNSTMAVSLAEVNYATLAEDNAAYITADFQEVFNGEVTGTADDTTFEFTFTTPYVYTGKNLVIEVKNVGKGSTWAYVNFYGQEPLGDINGTYGYSGTFKYNVGFLPKVSISYAEVIEEKDPIEVGTEFTENGLTFIVKSETEVGVTAVSNDVTECIVPEIVTYNDWEFTVTSIERDAFYWSNVHSVVLPNSITSIAYGAFRSSALASIELPASVQTIGEFAFYKTNISTIAIPEGVTAIEASTFSQCELLATITLPSTLQKIGQAAFYKSAITTIDIPTACTAIGMYAFESCTALASINLPEGLAELPTGLFQGCTSLSTITIPESVTTINENAFQSTGLESVHFPKNVTDLKANAFNDTPLAAISIAEENTTYAIVDGVLYSADKRFIYLYPRVTESKTYNIIDGCVAVMGGAFYGCDIKTVTFPEGFIGIDAYGFCLSDLEEADLPDTLSELWTQAFAGTKLTEVTLPKSITKLNEAVFGDCANLTTVTLPASITDIANRAFFRCTALTTINCLGETPAEFDAWETYTDPFFGVDCSKATVKCPISAVDSYKASEWADFFTNIEGSDFSGIETMNVEDIQITADKGKITVQGANISILIAGVNGAVICNASNIENSFVSPELARGVYVVSVRNAAASITKKIVL